MRDDPRSVRQHLYRDPAPLALHLQGEPPEPDLRASTTRRIPAQADSSAAPPSGPLLLNERAGLASALRPGPRALPLRGSRRASVSRLAWLAFSRLSRSPGGTCGRGAACRRDVSRSSTTAVKATASVTGPIRR